MTNWKDNWKQSLAVMERHAADNDGPGMFLNLRDGDSYKVVFLEAPTFARERQWDNVDKCSKFPSEIANPAELLANGKPRYDRTRASVSFNVLDVTNAKAPAVRIFEANITTARLIYSAFDMMDGCDKAIFELSRSGAELDTSYKLSKVSNIPAEKREKLRAKYLGEAHDLEDIQGDPLAGPGGSSKEAAKVVDIAPAAVPAVTPDGTEIDDFDLF